MDSTDFLNAISRLHLSVTCFLTNFGNWHPLSERLAWQDAGGEGSDGAQTSYDFLQLYGRNKFNPPRVNYWFLTIAT
jgi:hypothetical protein